MASPEGYPVSIKGVVVQDGAVLLLKNERDEWELPGGRIEIGETPEQCVAREVEEETSWQVRTGPIIDSWMYHIDIVDKFVFVVTYGCFPESGSPPRLSHEHKEVGLFREPEIDSLCLPGGYRRSIARWFGHLRAPETVG